jgi:signal transduction histidine kinase
MKLSTRFHNRPNLTMFVAVLLVAFIGVLDYITGYDVSLFVFYGLPIMLVVWYVDCKPAMLIALLSALVWWWADIKSGHPYITDWMQVWNSSVRLVFFVFVAFGGAAMKGQRDAVANELEAVNRARQLEREIVAAGEREQLRIGQDLHDGLCQYLAAIGCAATSLKMDLDARFLPEAASAAEIEELLKDAVVQARNISRGIAPVHMDETGLPSALEELSAAINRHPEIECILECNADSVMLDTEKATHLFRIAQEAMNNAVKHAQARCIHLSLVSADAATELRIADDGVGFSVATDHAQPTGGMGLKTMRYRARLIGADLQFSTGENGGTVITCRLRDAADAIQKYDSAAAAECA